MTPCVRSGMLFILNTIYTINFPTQNLFKLENIHYNKRKSPIRKDLIYHEIQNSTEYRPYQLVS